ncbi:MAG: hypothetical protein K2M46_02030 [Lachnospiraceae bacterium]|nr:hypothetical protein [Lachnospiraceae bacterium]
MKKIQKGTYGYLVYQKRRETIKTLLLFALSFAIFFVGYATTGTRRNLLTVVAVVSVLPAAKQLTTAILYYHYPSGSEETYEKIQASVENATCLSDIVITAYDKIHELLHITIIGKTVVGFSEKTKTDEKHAAEFIKTALEKNGFHGVSVKIYKEEKAYINRIQEMQKNLAGERKEVYEQELAAVIKAISI